MSSPTQLGLLAILAVLSAQLYAEEPLPPPCKPTIAGTNVQWFMESQKDNLWTFKYDWLPVWKQTRKNIPRPFASIALADVDKSPTQSALRLLESLDPNTCQSIPKALELKCSVNSSRPHNSGKGELLNLRCTQQIDGIGTQRLFNQFIINTKGSINRARLNIIDPQTGRLDPADWPSDEEARALADTAFLAVMNDSPDSPRRETGAIHRYYGAKGPIIQVTHTQCGTTTINARTREASYSCGNPPAVTGWRPHNRKEKLLQIDGLPKGFYPKEALPLNEGGYLLWGRVAKRYTRPGSARTPSLHVFRLNERGKVIWHYQVPDAIRVQILPQGDQFMLVQLARPTPYEQSILTTWLDSATGLVNKSEKEWRIPAGAGTTLHPAGEAIYHFWSEYNESFIAATNPQGQQLWRHALEANLTILDARVTSNGEAILLLRDALSKDHPIHSIHRLSQEGETRTSFTLQFEPYRPPTLIGNANQRIYVKGGRWRSNRGHGERVQAWDFRTGQKVAELNLPEGYRVSVTNRESLLYSFDDRVKSSVGELGLDGSQVWSQQLSAGTNRSKFSIPVEVSLTQFLTFASSEIRSPGNTQARAMMLVINAEVSAVKQARCPKPTNTEPHPGAANVRWDYPIQPRPSPTLSSLVPDCPAEGDRAYARLVQTLNRELKPVGLSSRESPSITLLVEEGRPGIVFPYTRFQGMDMSDSLDVFHRAMPGALHFRAHPDDAEALARLLNEQVAPHLQKLQMLRGQIYNRSGVTVMSAYQKTGLEQSLLQAEHELVQLRDIALRNPVEDYPAKTDRSNQGRHSQPPMLLLFRGSLQFIKPNYSRVNPSSHELDSLTPQKYLTFVQQIKVEGNDQPPTQ